ncbi:hypothetical protein T439DRAFT_347353 [Meredithblackwellia eburnea MCA 4105]
MMKLAVLLPLLLVSQVTKAATSTQPTWCGKNYEQGSPATAPAQSSFFTVPSTSSSPLLNLVCGQAIAPSVLGDSRATIAIRSQITHDVGSPIGSAPTSGNISVKVQIANTVVLQSVSIPVNSSLFSSFDFDLSVLSPSTTPSVVSCQATASSSSFTVTSSFIYLPQNPTTGASVVKMDKRTGAMLVPNGTESWEPFFPLGFFTAFGGYLDSNLAYLDDLKAKGVNTVHPIPPFDNTSALDLMLDKMQTMSGMYLMYDMRFTYTNLTSVKEEVDSIKSRPNLLLWYTGDEPDGSSDPENAGVLAYETINQEDGYHPVSLVLNCEDYKWTTYSAGADIIMQDTYPLYVNTTYSTEYHTVCNTTYGCCGCDNCEGNFNDIVSRIDSYYDRIHYTGRDLNATVWSTFQAFSGQFWSQNLTESQYLVMSVLSINHGSTGIISWQVPTTDDILNANLVLSNSLSSLIPFILSPSSLRSVPSTNSTIGSIDTALWTQSSSSLLLVANLGAAPSTFNVNFPSAFSSPASVLSYPSKVTPSLSQDGKSATITLSANGVAGWTFQHAVVNVASAAAAPTATSSGGGGGGSAKQTSSASTTMAMARGTRRSAALGVGLGIGLGWGNPLLRLQMCW